MLLPSSHSANVQAAFNLNLLLPLRVFIGLTFLYAGVQHLTDPSYFDPSKPGYIGHLVTQYAVGSPIRDFLVTLVAPNAVVFGYLVAFGEGLIGISVLLGLLFRVATIAGLLLNFVFFLSATWNAFPFYFGSDIVFDMCWLTLLLTGPQSELSLDGLIARRFRSLGWLISTKSLAQTTQQQTQPEVEGQKVERVPIPERAKLYPKQIFEINRAFDRIKQQFVYHQETQTVLEFVRAFVISFGVDRSDAVKLLEGLQNLVRRDASQQVSP